MEYVRKTYIEYLEHGVTRIEGKIDEVLDRELKSVKLPDKAYGFRFFDIIVAQVEVDGRLIDLHSKRINESPVYYCRARVLTHKEVTEGIPNNEKLLLYMNINGWDKVIQTHTGQFLEFREEDVILD
ncbi:MAG TPA: hypothetical protein VFF49_05340 [Thermodesulfobacteriota bacterium]|nr:hypothetical protein [Thermodesulfobacteriota bacterium]